GAVWRHGRVNRVAAGQGLAAREGIAASGGARALRPARVIPVIMCGGAGTRLWAVSRESMPKQFVPLVGQGTTFQQVLERISDPELFARAIVLTSSDFRFVVAEQLRERGIEADIVLQPMRRGF